MEDQTIEGRNFAELVGFVNYPKLTTTQNGNARFQASIRIPITYERDGEVKTANSYLNVVAWGDIAEAMGLLEEGVAVKIHGKFNVRNYDSSCRSCGEAIKLKWAEVTVSNFMEL